MTPFTLARARELASRHGFAAVFVAALVANLLPLTAKYLPFTDLSGHMGLAAALVRADETAARTAHYFFIDVRLVPTHLYDFFAWQVGRVVGVPAATNLFLALFVVAAFPLSVWYALRVFRRDERLALLAFPLVYHRCVWYGFINFVSGVPMVIAGVAVLASLLESPREKPNVIARRAVALSLLAWLVVFAHFFAAAAFFGFAALLLALRPIALHRQPVALLAMAPGLRFLWTWIAPKLATANGAGGPTVREQLAAHQRQLLDNPEKRAETLELLYDWANNGLLGRVDDDVLRVAVATLAVAFAWSIAQPARGRDTTRWRLRAPLLLAATAAVFVALPMELTNPPWWAVNVRVIAFLWALAIVAVPRARRPMPAWLLAPVAAASIFYGVYLTWDFHAWYNGVEMAGLDRALDHIPPGHRVQALWPGFGSEQRYSHFPMAHAGQYYLVRRGGLAVPVMDGAPDDLWVTPAALPPQVPWGQRGSFSWSEHGAHWDYFLVKDRAPGVPQEYDNFAYLPEGAVRLVTRQGLWRVYERVR